MTHSMTAYARKTAQETHVSVMCELRSVNHRYLELSVRLPDALTSLEMTVREHIRRRVIRGKVDCSFRLESTADSTIGFSVNVSLVDGLVHAAQTVAERLRNPAPVNPIDLLRWPGVLEGVDKSLSDNVLPLLMTVLDDALTEFAAVRQREGDAINVHFFERLAQMEGQLKAARKRLPTVQEAQRERLITRFNEANVLLDAGRLEQEMVLFAQRMDVAEELERLDAHITEVRRVLAEPGAIGRRLDFLMQEMNREANTLGSKATDTDMTRASVELKVLIEQMREQVQNVE